MVSAEELVALDKKELMSMLRWAKGSGLQVQVSGPGLRDPVVSAAEALGAPDKKE